MSKVHHPAPKASGRRSSRFLVGLVRALAQALLTCAIPMHAAQAQSAPPPAPVPTFDELEAAGVRIGEIRVISGDIFDTDDPREDNGLFRLANKLHIQTRPEVIKRALLFKRGELVSKGLIDETERLLRANRYLYEVRIVPTAVRDGVVDIEVQTRDNCGWAAQAVATARPSSSRSTTCWAPVRR
jgi:hypothetical protein